MESLAIVGAGPAGVGAAYALRDADVDVTILEKSRGVCGRAATRRRNDCRYDHGANYVKADDRTDDLLRELGEDGLVDVELPVWTFTSDGAISAGDEERGDAHKWTWETGITQLAKRLLDRTDATVERETRVEAVERVETGGVDGVEGARDEWGWHLADTDGEAHGPFDALVLTPPAPQTAALLAATHWQSEHLPALREAVGSVSYRPTLSAILHYPFELDRPWYGLVNVDKDHDVGWLSREECKRGHVPDGETLLVVQLGAEWSDEHYDDPEGAVVDAAAAKAATLLDDDRLADPDWTDLQRWRYAQPNEGADADVLRRGEVDGLYFAGDWVVGEGRVHRALWNGYEVGERIGEGR
ncbi:NAD(P)/FAD-dependent oxidoreductase [Halobium salinum]|uniref:NAD(P)/FAD-dependent oxidoreductase n=1 Tax=Halobium salinum TaxID=1364940 RepID=A0ABD5P9N4_9EURY|nr:FAD-dependent oxidoreductase [Halobium salinum]